jgi:peptidoglycan/LPS O-acetylase OafA/YrhL
LGTNVFLALSGFFTVYLLIDRGQPPLAFLRRRLARLYPPYLIVASALIATQIFLHGFDWLGTHPIRLISAQLLLVPIAIQGYPWLLTAWTVAMIVSFYFAVAALTALGWRGVPPRLRLAISLVAIAGCALGANHPQHHLNMDPLGVWLGRGLYLFLGMALAEWKALRPAGPFSPQENLALAVPGGAALAARFALLSASETVHRLSFVALTAFGTAALLALVLVPPAAPRGAAFLRSRLLLLLGAFAYPLYLVELPVIQIVHKIGGLRLLEAIERPHFLLLSLFVQLGLALAVAWMLEQFLLACRLAWSRRHGAETS